MSQADLASIDSTMGRFDAVPGPGKRHNILDVCEQRGLRFLLRLRKTINVKRLIERLFRREDWTRTNEASQGWRAIEDELRLSGWRSLF